MKLINSRIANIFAILRDLVYSDLLYIIPFAFVWFYRLKIKQNISSFLISLPSKKNKNTAVLYFHNKLDALINDKTIAVVLLHGMYGHPFSLLNLADIAHAATIGPVFSIHLTYDDKNPHVHRYLLKKAIAMIEKIIQQKKGSLKGLLVAGHSMGAIEAAYRAYVLKDKRFLGVISIAGRLRTFPHELKYCSKRLKPTLDKIYQAILALPNLPLFQIIGGLDWNASIEASLIRHEEGFFHIVENAMHLNILYHQETQDKFLHYLKKAI